MVNDAAWRLEVYDGTTFTLRGLCDAYTRLSVNLKHRAGGGWALEVPASHHQAALFSEGARIAVWAEWDRAAPLMSGPVTALATVTPDANRPAMLTVSGVDDTALLADRIVLPDPSSPPDDQAADSHWTYTGPAEAAIREAVGRNAGRTALPYRRFCDNDPHGRLASGCIGSVRNVSARFDNLLTLVNDLASLDNLAVRLYQPPGIRDLHLDVAATTDRSEAVLLSFGAGTLNAANATVTAPTATHVLVAGGGEGTDRLLLERADPALAATWSRRIETLRDARDTDDLAVLAERGDETLAEAGATAGLSLDPTDLPGQQFGVHYRLGDTVRVTVAGSTWTDVVTAVQIDVTADGGAAVKPSVGNPDTADLNTPLIYRRVRDIIRRIDALERRQ
jgi:hypothetical protein